MTPQSISVLELLPFWRYAVGPTNGRNPAIPYYRLADAQALFEEAKRELPWAGVCLYRRRFWHQDIEVIQEYKP